MRTDSLFYKLFQISPNLFFELLGPSASPTPGYQFQSVEIKQPNFRIDGVFLPPENEIDSLIYFTEVQFQRTEGFYRKLFAEIFLYLEQENPVHDWQAVALFGGRSLDPGLPRQYRALAPSHLRVVYLDELKQRPEESIGAGLVHLIVAQEREAIVQAHRIVGKLKEEPGKTNQEWMELAETILMYKFPRMTTEELEEMFQIEDLKETRVYQEAFHAGETQGIERGIERGIEQGIERGLIQGLRETVLGILADRFGVVPQEVSSRIQMMGSLERLREMRHVAVTARSLEDFQQQIL